MDDDQKANPPPQTHAAPSLVPPEDPPPAPSDPPPPAPSDPPPAPTDPPPAPTDPPPAPTDPPPFDPSKMIGIIRRKALIKELAAVYHAECLTYCQELMEFQKKWEEPYLKIKKPEHSRKDPARLPKRLKKTR